MRKAILLAAFAAFAFAAAEASAVTVLNTTQADVKKQCEGKTKCMRDCGSTYCNYVCNKPKQQCTVSIYRQAATGGRRPVTGGAARRADR